MKRVLSSLVLALLLVAGSFGSLSAAPAPVSQLILVSDGRAVPDTGARVLSNAVLSRYPYIQSTTTNSTTIAWRTETPVAPVLEYGLSPEYGQAVTGTVSTRDHAFTLTGLTAGTTYHYRISAGGAMLTPYETFSTAPGPEDTSFSFAAFGDSGYAGKYLDRVAGLVKTLDPDLLIHAGDLIYPGGEAQNFDPLFFAPYRDVLKSKPFFGILGNHDVKTGSGKPWLDALHLPQSASGGERYYSFDWGNAHFAALDVTHDVAVAPEQLAWLDDDLGSTSQTWKIVFLHVPPYSSSNHGSALNVRASLSPVLERHGVSLVVSGHDHVYERSKPINGITYIVTGGGGAKLYSAGTSHFTAYSRSAWHVTDVQIDRNTLTLRAIETDGTVIDTAVIRR